MLRTVRCDVNSNISRSTKQSDIPNDEYLNIYVSDDYEKTEYQKVTNPTDE